MHPTELPGSAVLIITFDYTHIMHMEVKKEHTDTVLKNVSNAIFSHVIVMKTVPNVCLNVSIDVDN